MRGDKQQKMWLWPVLILTLLTLLTIISLTDRFLIAAFGAQITTELSLSNQQFGLLTGFGFVLFYAVAGPFMGILADRFGASRLLGIGILLWSAMTALTGQAKSLSALCCPVPLSASARPLSTLLPQQFCRKPLISNTVPLCSVCILWVGILVLRFPTKLAE